MRSLTLLCSLILSIVVFSLSAADTYTVNTRSKLNLRSGPGTSYSVVAQLSPGATVTMIDDNDGKWVKVEGNGVQGYAMKKYLTIASHDSSTANDKRYSVGNDPHNKWLLWTIVGLFVVVIVNNVFEILENKFFMATIYMSLPAAIILYTYITPKAMWFCDPDTVGWLLTILNVFLVIVALSFCVSTCFSIMGDVFSDFSFLLLIIGLLFGAASIYIVITAIKELLIVAVIMLLGAGGGSTYVGTFIDSDGRAFDIFKS